MLAIIYLAVVFSCKEFRRKNESINQYEITHEQSFTVVLFLTSKNERITVGRLTEYIRRVIRESKNSSLDEREDND